MDLSSSSNEDERHARVTVLLGGYLASAGLRFSMQTTADVLKGLGDALDELAPAIRFRGVDGSFLNPAPGKSVSPLIPAEWQQLETVQAPIAPVRSGQGLPQTSGASVTLDELFGGWSAEFSRQKTLYSWKRVVEELTSYLGHDDASRISPDNLIGWKAALIKKGRKPKTIRDGKLAPIRAILQWGVDNRRLEKNAGERVTIDLRAKVADRKRAYTDDEARTVLKAAMREKTHCESGYRYCARIQAPACPRFVSCALRTLWKTKEYGAWKFAPEAGALKNASSERSVPLHPWVIEQGFLEFVRGAKSGALFPNVTPDRFGSRGGNGTKIIRGRVRALGIEDPRVSPNHSWRHRLPYARPASMGWPSTCWTRSPGTAAPQLRIRTAAFRSTVCFGRSKKFRASSS